MRKAVIIADDLSGANDAGCKIFENGFKCTTLDASSKDLGSFLDGFKGIAVINTASRLLAPAAAYKTVYSVVSALNTCGFIYKKIDSTLRGNIGPEIDACIDALKIKAVALVPAYPELGRKTVYGRHFYKEKLLENTEFFLDPVGPVLTSDISSLLRKQSKYGSVLVDIDVIRQGKEALNRFLRSKIGKEPVIFIFDCLNNSDLKVIAQAVKNFRVVAGASALAGYIFPRKKEHISVYPKVNERTAYFIGSLKEITHKQVARLRKSANISVCQVISDSRSQIKGRDFIFTVKKGKRRNTAAMRRKIEAFFSRKAVEIINKEKFGRLFISGGATAETVFKALKINYTEIKAVIFPGVPLTYSPEKNLYIVTKPGSFGDENALLGIYDRFKRLL